MTYHEFVKLAFRVPNVSYVQPTYDGTHLTTAIAVTQHNQLCVAVYVPRYGIVWKHHSFTQ